MGSFILACLCKAHGNGRFRAIPEPLSPQSPNDTDHVAGDPWSALKHFRGRNARAIEKEFSKLFSYLSSGDSAAVLFPKQIQIKMGSNVHTWN
jgi:hypothetical protein